jgi:hypothetical protein
MSYRTLQAVRQAVYNALTAPPLSYQINADAPITLGVANVSPRAVWTPAVGGQAMPLSPSVAFSVQGKAHEVLLAERDLRMKIWVSSNSVNAPDDEVTELYEAVRSRLHGADDSANGDWLQFPPASLSRADGDGILGVAMRRCREIEVLTADFEPNSARWYVSATYEVIAV